MGTWPVHCVRGTPGASFHPELDVAPVAAVFSKGAHAAAYSGFEGTTADGVGAGRLAARSTTWPTVDVVGIATDHCVRATALDAARAGLRTTVLLDLTAGVAQSTVDNALADAGRRRCHPDRLAARRFGPAQQGFQRVQHAGGRLAVAVGVLVRRPGRPVGQQPAGVRDDAVGVGADQPGAARLDGLRRVRWRRAARAPACRSWAPPPARRRSRSAPARCAAAPGSGPGSPADR